MCNSNLRVGLSTLYMYEYVCIYLSYSNAGVLPPAVIIKFTRRRKGGIRGGVMEREILNSEDMKGFSFVLA